MNNVRWSVGIAVVIIFMSGSICLKAESITEQTTANTSTVTPYRELADQLCQAFENGQSERAASAAQSLETAWDLNAGYLHIKAPELYKEIDEAMDKLIKPVINYKKSLPAPQEIQNAYQEYLKLLEKAQEPTEGTRVAGDDSVDIMRTPTGLVYFITTHGTGEHAVPGGVVLVRLSGFLGNETQFRRTKSGADSEVIPLLYDGYKIPGLIEGLSLLRGGDIATLIIPPTRAYGKGRSHDGVVPPNSTLTYFVEVVNAKAGRLGEVLQKAVEDKGVDYALAQYKQLQGKDFPDIYAGEEELNSLGYWLLQKGDSGNAVRVFQLNMQAFPKSANVYDSLGEAYAANGRKELAIETYQKALSIDPKMESSIDALKKLQNN